MKKTITLLLAVFALIFALTGCGRSDIRITLNKDGTGSVAASFGIDKAVYEQLKAAGADIFEGKTVTEQKYGDATYVTYTETKEYKSYDEIKAALLELTYNTDKLEGLNEEAAPSSDPSEYTLYTPEPEKKDDHIFSSIDLDSSSGIFYSVYSFRATVNPPVMKESTESSGSGYKVTITVNMPEKITQNKGGAVDGKTIVFDFGDFKETTEIAAVSESNHYGAILGICGGLVVIVAALFIFIKKKK